MSKLLSGYAYRRIRQPGFPSGRHIGKSNKYLIVNTTALEKAEPRTASPVVIVSLNLVEIASLIGG